MVTKYLSPALVMGFAGAVIASVPFLKGLGCCLIIPAFAGYAVYIDYRLSGKNINAITESKALLLGLLTATFAAAFSTLFETGITFLLRRNDLTSMLPQIEVQLQEIMGNVPKESLDLLRNAVYDITNKGYSVIYSMMILIGNLATYLPFGLAGGLIGLVLIKRTIKNNFDQNL